MLAVQLVERLEAHREKPFVGIDVHNPTRDGVLRKGAIE